MMFAALADYLIILENTIRSKVISQSTFDNTFDYFGYEREAGDRT